MRQVVFYIFLAGCGGAAATHEVTVAAPTATVTTDATVTAQPLTTATAITMPTTTASARPTALAGTPIRFVGGDGSSVAHAIVIRGAAGEGDGVAAEYKYLAMVYGPKGTGHKVLQQSLLNEKGHAYDQLDLELKDGSHVSVVFDITDYFGKF